MCVCVCVNICVSVVMCSVGVVSCVYECCMCEHNICNDANDINITSFI